MGLPASTVRIPSSAADEALRGDVRLACPALEAGPAFTVGGVRLVDVDLDHGAASEEGLMLGLVAIGVVGVDRVGHVGRDQERLGDGAMIVLRRIAGETLQAASQEVRCRSLRAAAADFLVVVQDDASRDFSIAFGGRQSGEPRMTAREVVDAPTVNELPAHTAPRRGLHVVSHQVPGENVLRMDITELFGD
jgi:hypothetical protein